MKHTPNADADGETLGTTLTSLSDSADGLSRSVRELNSVVDELQVSTERCGENQRAASESLSRAADSLEPVSVDATSASSSGFAPADD